MRAESQDGVAVRFDYDDEYAGNGDLLASARLTFEQRRTVPDALASFHEEYLDALGKPFVSPPARDDVAEIRRGNEAWLRSTGICRDEAEFRHFQKIDCAAVAALTYADQTQEIVQLGTDLIAWLFLFDDRYGEGTGTADEASMVKVFEAMDRTIRERRAVDPDCRYHVSMVSLLDRLAAYVDQAWLDRFAHDIWRYMFLGCLGEYKLRNGHEPITLARYLEVRRNSISALPVLDLLDLRFGGIVGGNDISVLREITAGLLAWVNDIGSFRKESKAKDPMNLVSVIQKEFATTENLALKIAVEVHNAELARFDQVAAFMANSGLVTPDKKSYIAGLRTWQSGNYYWCLLTPRYTRLD